jgi:hypothetical protein
MTCIANFKTKKAFKEACDSSPYPYIEDPSIFSPWDGPIDRHPALACDGGYITVTNHPKRSWFAMVKRSSGGLKVS